MPCTPRPRAVRRARARMARAPHPSRCPRHVRRICAQAAAAEPAPRPRVECTPREDRPVYDSVYAWLRARMPRAAYPTPAVKRLTVLVSGLLVTRPCTLGGLAAAVEGLAIGPATEESVARRLRRILAEDDRLDPPQALPALFAAVLPALLADVLARHAASERRVARGRRGAAAHRAGAPLLRIVIDDSSQAEHVHLLIAGLAYRGIVLPLAVRTWVQNAALPAGEYWTQVIGLLTEVQALLPPALRDHVLLVADRAFGVPRLLDLLGGLGWHWLLRVQGPTRVLLRDGTIRAVRSLAPRPGDAWFGRFDPVGAPPADAAATGEAVAVFKAAGWRASQVVAAWAPGADAPWLLVTSLAPTATRLLEYAQRWTVERLFLCWKSHGWDLETCGVHDPVRLGRLLTGLVIATLWTLAAGVLDAVPRLTDLRARAARRARHRLVVRQPHLPLWDPPPPQHAASRPYAAKRSLFTRGQDVWRRIAARVQTAPLLWHFPDWDAPIWSRQTQLVDDGLTP